ncbi:V4R domain-containing protein [Desulfonema magnum]|uniref:4-vinyl reductase domain-containing protein n=1 Tax=Desulfonema magnum TaxID=45655 RepID=A0A975BTU0_9BACT|nr:V4R domain-containing protein [Desulfonema magnum]QTA91655.1 4-vinyl reductase domain-containing protein [Desulfonema magnum]
MFKEDRQELQFSWNDLGNIREGRPNLGDTTSVTAYRLMQYTLRDVLIKQFGPQAAGNIYYEAGKKAGTAFCENLLNTDHEFSEFVAELQKKLIDHHIGILRMEEADLDSLNITVSIYEDLDCSGLPMSDETVCDYDEGFLAGILESYTGKELRVKEIDCWATGARVCRFKATKRN